MSDQFLLVLASTSIVNFAILVCVWVDGGHRVYPGQTIAGGRVNARFEDARWSIEHAKEMLLIDIRRREQLLDIRLKRIEQRASIR
ncbi:MAG: hypothetical protein ABSG41_22475 [Bryobacteraceae bacterium]|jgi:hypothetical protein